MRNAKNQSDDEFFLQLEAKLKAMKKYLNELITFGSNNSAVRAGGRLGGCPRKMDVPTLKIAMAAMQERTTVGSEVAKRLNMTPTTLYSYLNGDGTLKEAGFKLLYP